MRLPPRASSWSSTNSDPLFAAGSGRVPTAPRELSGPCGNRWRQLDPDPDPGYRASMTLTAIASLLLGVAHAGPGWAPRGRAEGGKVIHAELLLSLDPEIAVHGTDGRFVLADGSPMRGDVAPVAMFGMGWHRAGHAEFGGRLLVGASEPAALHGDRGDAKRAIEGGVNPLRIEFPSILNPRLEPYAMVDVEIWHIRLAADVFWAATLYPPYGWEARDDGIGRMALVSSPGASGHFTVLKSALGQGVDLGVRASVSRPLGATTDDAIAAADDFRFRTGTGELSPLGVMTHIGVALRIDGLTVDSFAKRSSRVRRPAGR